MQTMSPVPSSLKLLGEEEEEDDDDDDDDDGDDKKVENEDRK